MTAIFDRAFIALGVDAHEITSLKGRTAIYLGLIAMAATAATLIGGIASNLTAPVA